MTFKRPPRPNASKNRGYYGLPILKRPFWKWEIALYFFCEGISAGSYILCTVADFVGNHRFRTTIRAGRYLSFATLLPCPPLLIADLGRPERFHHMLRIWKRTSPMNHGAWALSGYGMFSALSAAAETPPLGALARCIPRRFVSVLGMPFALTMVSYPGVLLSTTSNPIWAKSHFLGSLLACSSMSTAVSAMTLLNYGSKDETVHKSLARFEDVASTAETVALGAYLVGARQATRPLFKGKQSKLFLLGAVVAGLIAPAILRRTKSKALNSGSRAVAHACRRPRSQMVHHLRRPGVRDGCRTRRSQLSANVRRAVLGPKSLAFMANRTHPK